MFEAKPLNAAPYATSEMQDSGRSLHPVRWPDLVAKLDAARDLRASLLAHAGEGEASFDAHCAQHIAALCDGKPDVNFDDLVNRKPEIAISRSATNGAARDDRESR